ncbi:Leucine-rich repeat - like 10, partial [Theobroma cacao]
MSIILKWIATKLEILSLYQNSFSGLIPNTLGNLRALEELCLWSNHLTAKPPNHEWSFLSSLANCKNLIVLQISSNPLYGILPTFISNLSASLQDFCAMDCKIK